MSAHDTTIEATPDAPPPDTLSPAASPSDRPAPGWRQRLFGLRSVIAVAVAGLLLGGLGGAGLGYAARGGDQAGPGRGGFGGPMRGGQQGQQGGQLGQQGFPGQQGGQQGQPGQGGGPQGQN